MCGWAPCCLEMREWIWPVLLQSFCFHWLGLSFLLSNHCGANQERKAKHEGADLADPISAHVGPRRSCQNKAACMICQAHQIGYFLWSLMLVWPRRVDPKASPRPVIIISIFRRPHRNYNRLHQPSTACSTRRLMCLKQKDFSNTDPCPEASEPHRRTWKLTR